MKAHAPLVTLCGPSGSGKSAIAARLSSNLGLIQGKSITTRPPRFTGEDGYHFVSEETFRSFPDRMLETCFAGYHYAVTRQILDESDLLIVDLVGARELREQYRSRKILVVGIVASPEVCRERMITRGDPLAKVEQRLINDSSHFSALQSVCDLVVENNGTVEEAVLAIAAQLQT